LTGEAFTFVSPDEMEDLRAIEKAIGKQLPRVTLPDFDYTARPAVRLEIPLAERIAQIRAKKAEDRARSKEKQARKAGGATNQGGPQRPKPSGGTADSEARTAGSRRSRPPRRGHRGSSGGGRPQR
jgi:ATP-dependent RNA helicase RhlE